MQQHATLYYELDTKGHIRRISRELLAILERDEIEVYAQPDKTLWSNNLPNALISDKEESITMRLNWQAVMPLKDKNNQEIWVTCFMAPIIIETQFLGYSVVCKRLSETKVAQAHHDLQALAQGQMMFYHGNLFRANKLWQYRLTLWLANLSTTASAVIVSVFLGLYLAIALLLEGTSAFLPTY